MAFVVRRGGHTLVVLRSWSSSVGWTSHSFPCRSGSPPESRLFPEVTPSWLSSSSLVNRATIRENRGMFEGFGGTPTAEVDRFTRVNGLIRLTNEQQLQRTGELCLQRIEQLKEDVELRRKKVYKVGTHVIPVQKDLFNEIEEKEGLEGLRSLAISAL